MNEKYYENYISCQLGRSHKDDFDLMSRYYQKNYGSLLGGRESRILDVGCGMGHFLYFLRENKYKDYVGIDLSQECIDQCKNSGLGDDSNLEKVDVETFLRRGQVFDVIILNDVIEHFAKDTLIENLEVMRKALNSNGRLIIKVVNSANPITGSGSRYYDFTHALGFTEESLQQVLTLAGFNRIQVLPQDIWVFNPFINFAGKTLQLFFNSIFRFLNLIYGRKSTRIFTKDIIGIGYK